MEDPRARARELLRQGNLRITEPRVSVLSALLLRQGPATAGELISDLEDVSLSEVTVYRNLNRLAEDGLLKRVDTPERRRRFELASDVHQHEHAHFVCESCGGVHCLEGDASPAAQVQLPEGFVVRAQRVVLHGVCSSCA